MFSQFFSGVTPPEPLYWGMAIRAMAQSLQYLVRTFLSIQEKSGKCQGISFGLERGHPVLNLRTSEAGIPALRKLPCGVGRRYTGFAQTSLWRQKSVYRRHGMSTPGVRSRYTSFVFQCVLASECPNHTDTDKTAAEKIIFPMKHSEFL